MEAKKERTSKHAQSFGAKNVSQHNTTASQVSVCTSCHFLLNQLSNIIGLLRFPKTTVFLLYFLHLPIALLGSISVADAAELSVSEAADSSGGVHVLSDTL